jgi:hypothetical protein
LWAFWRWSHQGVGDVQTRTGYDCKTDRLIA